MQTHSHELIKHQQQAKNRTLYPLLVPSFHPPAFYSKKLERPRQTT